MHIVIAGAGSVGCSIARELISHGHETTLMDNDPQKMRVASVAEADWILADACSPDALSDAGVELCDVMVAATGDDNANLVISLLSKSEFGVPRVVARVNNPKNEWMFDSNWGVDVPVSTPRIMTSLVEEAISVGSMVPLFTFHDSDAQMFAIVIPENSALSGHRVGDVTFPPRVVLTAILRDSRPISPVPDTSIEIGDELLLLVSGEEEGVVQDVENLIAPSRTVPDLAQDD